MKHFIFIALVSLCFPLAAQQADQIYSHKVGEYTITMLSEAQQKGSKDILIGATPEMLSKYLPDGTFPNAMCCYLVEMEGCNILVDTGTGKNLMDNLKSLGVIPEEIDLILLTHMHGDHIGGLMKEDRILFPNATVYLCRQEYDYWMSDQEMNKLPEAKRGGFNQARQVINAYKDKLNMFYPVAPGSAFNNLFPGVSAFSASGHTPGHTMYMFESGSDKLLIWGDLTHAMAIQMPHPEISVTYDVNPEQAALNRIAILDYVATKKIPVAGMHVAYPGMGKITKAKYQGYTFTPFK